MWDWFAELTCCFFSTIILVVKSASPQLHGWNGLVKAGDFTNGTEKPADSSTGAEGSSPVFNPLAQWGQPQGMPAPVLPSRGSTALGKSRD